MLQEFFNHYAEFEERDDFIKATSEERQRLAKEVGFIQFKMQITHSLLIMSVLFVERLLTWCCLFWKEHNIPHTLPNCLFDMRKHPSRDNFFTFNSI